MPVATFTWKTATSGDWSTASDWTPSGPPDSESLAIVAAAGSQYILTVSSAENVTAGDLVVDSTSATVDVAGTLTVANSLLIRNGRFDVLNAGLASVGSVGISIGQGGTINVSGTSSAAELVSTGNVVVGSIGTGALLAIGNHGALTGTDLSMLSIGATTGTGGTVTVDGGELTGFGGIEIGGAGFGTLAVTNGGQVVITNATLGFYVGSDAGGGGGVLLIDNGSTFSETGRHFHIGGHNDSASVVVRNSSRLITSNDHGDGFLIATAIEGGSVSIESGSTWIANGQIGVGAETAGTLDVNNGLVDASGFVIYVASNSGGSGTLLVENGGTILAGNLSINPSGTDAIGTLAVGPGGTLKISGSITDGPGGKISVNGGTIITGGIILGQESLPGPAEMTIGSGGTVSVTDFLTVGPSGVITLGGGLLRSSASAALSGNARVQGHGKLESAVTLGSSANVIHSSGGTLEITGSISGNGTLELGSGSALRLDTAPTNNLTVTFGSASSETLILNNPNIGGPSIFTAVTGVGINDLIDFGGGITIQNVSYTPVAGGSDVTLNVTKGAITGTITLNNVQFTGGANKFAIATNNGDAALQAIYSFSSGPNTAPSVTILAAPSYAAGTVLTGSQLFSVSDAQGTSDIDYVKVFDANPEGGAVWRYSNAVITPGSSGYQFEHANRNLLSYTVGSGSNQFLFEAFDNAGDDSNDALHTITATANQAPTVTGPANLSGGTNQTLSFVGKVAGSDPDGSVQQFRFSDSSPGSDNGYLTLNGTKISGTSVTVSAASLGTIGYFTGTVAGSNGITIKAIDNLGKVSTNSVTPTILVTDDPPPNQAPTVTGPANLSGGTNQTLSFVGKVGGSDPDGSVQQFRGSDSSPDSDNGYLTLNGTKISGASVTDNLGDNTYHVDDPATVILEPIDGGSDTVLASVGYRLPTGSEIEFLTAAGGAGLALTGNESANTITGEAGDDTIVGGGGADVLFGGAGADIFALAMLPDSTVDLAGWDTIGDFSTFAGDVIELSGIDANPGFGGDQAFTFIGTAAFSGMAGQLRAQVGGGATMVLGDVNGDNAADFAIKLTGSHVLSGANFIL